MKSTGAWFFLLLLGLLLMVAGVQGSLGRIIAVIFVPDMLRIGDSMTGLAGGGGDSGFG
jgi:hypothetical protein